jgi:hypothetical protein
VVGIVTKGGKVAGCNFARHPLPTPTGGTLQRFRRFLRNLSSAPHAHGRDTGNFDGGKRAACSTKIEILPCLIALLPAANGRQAPPYRRRGIRFDVCRKASRRVSSSTTA